jgi:hypothetical protein
MKVEVNKVGHRVYPYVAEGNITNMVVLVVRAHEGVVLETGTSDYAVGEHIGLNEHKVTPCQSVTITND